MKLKLYLIPLLILVLIFGGIALAKSFGWWQTHAQKTPAKFENGAFKDVNKPYDIRGAYTFQDDVYAELSSEEIVHIELDEGAFAITGDTTVKDALEHGVIFEDLEAIIGDIADESFLIKDVAERNGFTFGKVKNILNELLH